MSPKALVLALLLALGVCVLGAFIALRGTAGISASSMTRLAMMSTLQAASEFAAKNGRYPASAMELSGVDQRRDQRDAWGQPIRYELRGDGLLILSSMGADGAPGGDGDRADTRLCAATRRADGTLALAGPDGLALRFLRSSEVTVYEFARLAQLFDRSFDQALDQALHAGAFTAGAEAAAQGLLSGGPVLDGWGTPIRVVLGADSVQLLSLGADGEPGIRSDSQLPLRDADRHAERKLKTQGESAPAWVYRRGEVDGVDGVQGEEDLFELDRRLR